MKINYADSVVKRIIYILNSVTSNQLGQKNGCCFNLYSGVAENLKLRILNRNVYIQTDMYASILYIDIYIK